MTDETSHIARAAASLDDPHAALNRHLHGDGDAAKPGSAAAIQQGCTCPILDNAHGQGYMGKPGVFVMNAGCPLHAPTHTDMMVTPESLDDWLTENPLPEETP